MLTYSKSIFHIERYQERVMSKDMNISTNMMNFIEKESNAEKRMQLRQEAK